MLIEFPGKKVLVAGAAMGIGGCIAQTFAETGARVFAGDILVDEVKKYAGSRGKGSISAHYADVTDEASVGAMVREAGADGLDVLVYVAGGVTGQAMRPIEEVSLANWNAIVNVNLTGAFLFARAVVPIMKKAKKGRIIVITSRAGLAPSLTGIQAYCAAKHGQSGLIKQLAKELTEYSITVNGVAPGLMRTNPATEAQWNNYTKEFQESLIAGFVGKRPGKANDIADTVMFLASDQAEWITGQIIPVMGGPL